MNFFVINLIFIKDAFGSIVFLGHSEQIAEYIKLSHSTDVKKIKNFLFSKSMWHMKKPKMLISVSGGTKLNINPDFKIKFCQGLYKVAKSTDAWIIDGGSHMGCMQLVGEAFKEECKTYGNEENRTVLLGIANWTTVREKDDLISTDRFESEGPIEYSPRQKMSVKEKSTSLDPFHSHFILVDNAHQNEVENYNN